MGLLPRCIKGSINRSGLLFYPLPLLAFSQLLYRSAKVRNRWKGRQGEKEAVFGIKGNAGQLKHAISTSLQGEVPFAPLST